MQCTAPLHHNQRLHCAPARSGTLHALHALALHHLACYARLCHTHTHCHPLPGGSRVSCTVSIPRITHHAYAHRTATYCRTAPAHLHCARPRLFRGLHALHTAHLLPACHRRTAHHNLHRTPPHCLRHHCTAHTWFLQLSAVDAATACCTRFIVLPAAVAPAHLRACLRRACRRMRCCARAPLHRTTHLHTTHCIPHATTCTHCHHLYTLHTHTRLRCSTHGPFTARFARTRSLPSVCTRCAHKRCRKTRSTTLQARWQISALRHVSIARQLAVIARRRRNVDARWRRLFSSGGQRATAAAYLPACAAHLCRTLHTTLPRTFTALLSCRTGTSLHHSLLRGALARWRAGFALRVLRAYRARAAHRVRAALLRTAAYRIRRQHLGCCAAVTSHRPSAALRALNAYAAAAAGRAGCACACLCAAAPAHALANAHLDA